MKIKLMLNNSKVKLFKKENEIKHLSTLDIVTKNLTSVEVPTISCYYFNPIFNINTDIKIPVYVTDYINSDYLYEDMTKSFTVITELNGIIKKHNVLIGDNILNLGKIPYEMNTYIIVKCIDNTTKMESYEQCIPIYIQDPMNHLINENNTYNMTEQDLITYNISNNDSKNPVDLVNTRKGLTVFFQDKANEGYKKIVLIKNSIFRMDYSSVSGDGTPVIIPSNMTIDMNESTFRINPQTDNTASGTTIVTNNGNNNTCLENGILQGSYQGNCEDNGDWDSFPSHNTSGGIICESAGSYNFNGGYCNTLKNMTVKNIQGYSITANSGSDIHAEWHAINKDTCKSCYIKNGKEIYIEDMLTTEYIMISDKIKAYGNLCFNRYKGYAGYKGRNGLEFFHWYDINKNFIKTTKGHQFRINLIPDNAKYVRITLFYKLEDYTDDHAFIQNLDFPTNINIENVNNINTRTCAITSSDYSFMRIYNCNFDNCGKNITPCWLDLEDGYEYGHNLYVDKCNVTNSPSTIDVICQYAHNLVIENCTNMSFSLGKCKNVTFRNNITNKILVLSKQWPIYNGYKRIYSNILNGTLDMQSYSETTKELQYLRIIKNNEIRGSIVAHNTKSGLDKIIGGSLIDARISNGLIEKANIVSASIAGTSDIIINDCIIDCSLPGNQNTVINNSTYNAGTLLSGTYNNCIFNSNVCSSNNVNIKNCGTLTYVSRVDGDLVYGERFIIGTEKNLIENCIINYTASSGSLVGIGDQRGKYADTHSTTFKNCIINMNDGTNLVNGYYGLSAEWMPDDVGYTVNFINCVISGNYSEYGNRLIGYEDRYIINYITE